MFQFGVCLRLMMLVVVAVRFSCFLGFNTINWFRYFVAAGIVVVFIVAFVVGGC